MQTNQLNKCSNRSGQVTIGHYEVDFDRKKKEKREGYCSWYVWAKNVKTSHETWVRYNAIRKLEKDLQLNRYNAKPYAAYVTVGTRKMYIDHFKTKEEAAQAERNAMQALYPGRVS